jgi:hypothetical protein
MNDDEPADLPVIIKQQRPTRYNDVPMDEARKAIFLNTLAETGSPSAAAEAATPWSQAKDGGLSAFRALREGDPAFAQAWDRAQSSLLAKVETEITRRAFEPNVKAVYWNGEKIGEELTYDNKLLLRLARKLDPEGWSEQQKIKIDGKLSTQHNHTMDLSKLSADELEAVLKLTAASTDGDATNTSTSEH